jgi:membrane-bound metal-dependent hydrolase YbcI (DUF457 family)
MDPLTHYLAGYLLGRYSNLSNAGIRAVTLCALLPDIDALAVLGGWNALCVLHRTATHSLLGALIIALVVTAGLALWNGKDQALQLLPWCLGGTLSHLLLDLFSYKTSLLTILGIAAAQTRPEYLEGLQLFWPLSDARFSVVNLGLLSQASTNVAMLAIFCVFVGSMLGGTIRGSRPWRIWTDPVHSMYGRLKMQWR